tara:strand:- start:625 stop:2322 length:1698 start_codon:yes stop_codon:yes gene_type:complete
MVLVLLVSLRLKNIAFIDSLELSFKEGFTVLTGETGAGKSILLDALDNLLAYSPTAQGKRLFRNDADSSQIEAFFITSPAVKQWLNEESLEIDDEISLSREWRFKEGRSTTRCRVNGVLINRDQIKRLRPLLIDLTGQDELHKFWLPSMQRDWLDRMGPPQLNQALQLVNKSWLSWKQAFEDLEKAKNDIERNELQIKYEKEMLCELNDANLEDPEEYTKLKLQENRLTNGVKLKDTLQTTLFHLEDGPENYLSVSEQLAISIKQLNSIAEYDPILKSSLDSIIDLQFGMENIISSLRNYSYDLDYQPNELEAIQDRIAKLSKLKRLYNMSIKDLMIKRDILIEKFSDNDEKSIIFTLEATENKARIERDKNNDTLTKLRKAIAIKFENKILTYLKPLGLSNAKFKVEINTISPTSKGVDCVNYLFSANPGQPLSPLHEVASGGEMSRFLLAFKTAVAQSDGPCSILFDEIDSGVSGRISLAVANLLKEMSLKRQVFCVTHQPIIAASADHHFSVSKFVKDGITRSKVVELSAFVDRQIELAELAGGDLIEAKAYAASLLEKQAA